MEQGHVASSYDQKSDSVRQVQTTRKTSQTTAKLYSKLRNLERTTACPSTWLQPKPRQNEASYHFTDNGTLKKVQHLVELCKGGLSSLPSLCTACLYKNIMLPVQGALIVLRCLSARKKCTVLLLELLFKAMHYNSRWYFSQADVNNLCTDTVLSKAANVKCPDASITPSNWLYL